MTRTVPWITLDMSPARRRRVKLHVSQARLADDLGVSPGTVSRWETGDRNLPAYRLFQMARVLGTPVQLLADVREGHQEAHRTTETAARRVGRPSNHQQAPAGQEDEGTR